MSSLADMEDVAERAATKAITKMLLTLGVDASDDKAMLAMQKDFAYLRSWRESIELVRRRGLITAVTVVTTGFLGMLYLMFKH